MMRTFASSLLRWLTVAAYGSRRVYFRHNGTEFPMVSLSTDKFGTLRGPRAAGCASSDAPRPITNWVNFKDKYETSFTWETFAAFARRIPTKERSPALSRRRREGLQENIL